MSKVNEIEPHHFVALSKVRAIVRDEIQHVCNDVLAEAIGRSIGQMTREAARECEVRCNALEAKIVALEARIVALPQPLAQRTARGHR
jgi:hypothetical protein